MSVAIKLARVGKRGKPNYRIIVIDKRKKTNSSYLEKLGFYNPLKNPAVLDFDKERLTYWIERGAVMTEGLSRLIRKKLNKINK